MEKIRMSAHKITLAVVGAILSSVAHSNELEVAPGMIVVPDPALDAMRGKYVASTTQVVYFGVQMQSNWATPDGSMLSAGANVTVNLTNTTPTVIFYPTANLVAADPVNGDTLTDTTGRTITSSGVDNISGVTQSVQLTGDYNSTKNLTRVNFLSEVPADGTPDGGITRASFDYNDGSVGMSGYSTLEDNSAVVHLQVDGQGVAEQAIRGTIQGAGGKGVYQTIMVLGDRHQITNQLDMNVVVRNASEMSVTQQSVGAAIGNLRGLIQH